MVFFLFQTEFCKKKTVLVFSNQADLGDINKVTSFLKHPQLKLSSRINKATKFVHHYRAPLRHPH